MYINRWDIAVYKTKNQDYRIIYLYKDMS